MSQLGLKDRKTMNPFIYETSGRKDYGSHWSNPVITTTHYTTWDEWIWDWSQGEPDPDQPARFVCRNCGEDKPISRAWYQDDETCARCALIEELSDWDFQCHVEIMNPTVAKILLLEELHKVKFDTTKTIGKNYFRLNCIEDEIFTEEDFKDLVVGESCVNPNGDYNVHVWVS